MSDELPLDLPTRLQYAYHIPHALADLHGIEYPSGGIQRLFPEIKADNVMINLNGDEKLSAFSDSLLRKRNAISGMPCPYYSEKYPVHWGHGSKPVEHSAPGYPPLDEKVDMFGLGGILFYILTGNHPIGGCSRGEATLAL